MLNICIIRSYYALIDLEFFVEDCVKYTTLAGRNWINAIFAKGYWKWIYSKNRVTKINQLLNAEPSIINSTNRNTISGSKKDTISLCETGMRLYAI
ncbi:hypothetical protein PSM36_0913 [Proteiniphilum saccharofermentans]|uniref:Uncharacterized protein n=1 Tax=Proteiniphilum saccharofermentans TaxID=1642647 RepID=A0A1R3T0S8_9BACT|nr:hypothetical protein PSM36_0913 [Proteiniphilum saccharofermentans]